MRARFLLLTAAIFAGVLVAPASALPSLVKSIDAPWVYFYADGSSGKQIVKDPIPRAYAVDKSLVKSSFKVDFTTTPAIYHPAINVAVDIWSPGGGNRVQQYLQLHRLENYITTLRIFLIAIFGTPPLLLMQ
jgi:hypothetical protein